MIDRIDINGRYMGEGAEQGFVTEGKLSSGLERMPWI